MNSQIEDKQDFDNSSEDFEQYSSVVEILKENLDREEITLRQEQREKLSALINTVEEPKMLHYQLFKKLVVAAVLLIIGVIVFEMSRPERFDDPENTLAIESGSKEAVGVDRLEDAVPTDTMDINAEQIGSDLLETSDKDVVDRDVAQLEMKVDNMSKKRSNVRETKGSGPGIMSLQQNKNTEDDGSQVMSLKQERKIDSSAVGGSTTSDVKLNAMSTRNRSLDAKKAVITPRIDEDAEEVEDAKEEIAPEVERQRFRSKGKSSKELSSDANVASFSQQRIGKEKRRPKSQKLELDDSSVTPTQEVISMPTPQLVNITIDAILLKRDTEVKVKVFYFSKDGKLLDSKLNFKTKLLANKMSSAKVDILSDQIEKGLFIFIQDLSGNVLAEGKYSPMKPSDAERGIKITHEVTIKIAP